ncbi:hypothetical protein [Oryzifoliimicrobium ureilyticus]|uniref:hypothetical protein n=1 Tax=Oryzifoliimicrobium ureilyticus TaxID=3113724 RepID=UPI00307660BB
MALKQSSYETTMEILMQKQIKHQPIIPQHVIDQLENEWRQVRPVTDSVIPSRSQTASVPTSR